MNKLKRPTKYDKGKPRIELIPPEFIIGCAKVLDFGAQKYNSGNWAKGSGFEWSRLYGANQRHMNAFWMGEELDPESKLSHLDHAACMLAFLRAHVARELGEDDRIDIGVKRNEQKRKRQLRRTKPRPKPKLRG